VAVVFYRGTIIEASQVPDRNGVNPKDRPVLLLVDFSDTDTDAYGVAITSTFPHPPPVTSIPLSYQRQGNCQTGLTRHGDGSQTQFGIRTTPGAGALNWHVPRSRRD
jgi:hypothetical protein